MSDVFKDNSVVAQGKAKANRLEANVTVLVYTTYVSDEPHDLVGDHATKQITSRRRKTMLEVLKHSGVAAQGVTKDKGWRPM